MTVGGGYRTLGPRRGTSRFGRGDVVPDKLVDDVDAAAPTHGHPRTPAEQGHAVSTEDVIGARFGHRHRQVQAGGQH